MKCARFALAVALSMTLAGALSAAEDERGFVSLLKGDSLKAWRGYHQEAIGKGWKLSDGELHFDGSGGGDIATRQQYRDFDLRFQWKVAAGSNSGVMYRVALGDRAAYFTGPEYQILDDSRHRDGQNQQTSAAALYALYAPQNKSLEPVGQWNEARIVVRGSKVEHWLNGKKVVEADMASDEWKKRVANSKFSAWERFGRIDEGHIVLQDHGDPVWYRDLRIKTLDQADKMP